MATCSASLHFSSGASVKNQVMFKAGLKVGDHTRKEFKRRDSNRRDSNRVKQAEARVDKQYKNYRILRSRRLHFFGIKYVRYETNVEDVKKAIRQDKGTKSWGPTGKVWHMWREASMILDWIVDHHEREKKMNRHKNHSLVTFTAVWYSIMVKYRSKSSSWENRSNFSLFFAFTNV